jgi:hypothetical protein
MALLGVLNFYAMYVVLSVGNYNKGFFSCDKERKFRNVCVKGNRN